MNNNQKIILSLGLILLLSACGGGTETSDETTTGNTSHSITAKAKVIAPGDVDCVFGGISVETGFDKNDNGVLDAEEINQTQKVCHGTPGTDGAPGENGSDGSPGSNGVDGVNGTDGADGAPGLNGTDGVDGADGASGTNGTNGIDGAPGINGIDGTNGYHALLAINPENPGNNCLYGGQAIDAGLDSNDNGVLDLSETGTTRYVCNGEPGGGNGSGINGLNNLIFMSSETAGTNCVNGGQRIESGLDFNRNGILEPAEVGPTTFVCNGLNGTDGSNGIDGAPGTDGIDGLTSLMTTEIEPAGANCSSGGQRINAGLDSNHNNTLDANEIGPSIYLCNGSNGATGATGIDGNNGLNALAETTIEAAGNNCSAGGVGIKTGLDSNNNGTLDDGEFTTRYLCNGVDGSDGAQGETGAQGQTGSDGEAGHNALAETSIEAIGINCANAGVRLDTGLDVNDNGNLDSGELNTRYICHGSNGLNGENGVDGADGATGPQGETGIDGTDGIDGIDGVDGANWWESLGSTGGLEGYVYFETGVPAENIFVHLSGTGQYAFTDGFGYYQFSYVSVGHQALKIWEDGYHAQELDGLPVVSGNTTPVRKVRLNKQRKPFDAKTSLVNAHSFPGLAAGDTTGTSVAIAGDVNGDGYDDILIGATDDIVDVNKAYLIFGRPGLDLSTVKTMVPDVTFTGNTNELSGSEVTSADDINGDGFADIVISAQGDGPAGAVYLIYGSNTLTDIDLSNADFTINGYIFIPDGGIKKSISGAGDVNGDGYDDILILGGPDPLDSSETQTTNLIYGGELSGSINLDDPSVMTFTSPDSASAAAGVGDVDGDGYDDILISDAFDTVVGYLIFGAANLVGGATNEIGISYSREAPTISAGKIVAAAGDVNGDGYDDFLIGAENANSVAGKTYLIYGRSRGKLGDMSLAAADAIFTGINAGDRSGASLAGAGDINNDGYGDFLIGALYATSDGFISAGETYLIYGSAVLNSRSLSSADVTFTGFMTSSFSGETISNEGDVNGDGFDNILIGASGASPDGLSNAGEAYLLMGREREVFSKGNFLSGTRPVTTADARFMGVASGDESGGSVANAGDVNGDGYDDILIGAGLADSGGLENTGESYLIYGGAGIDKTLALSLKPDVIFTGKAVGDLSGTVVAGAGDVNADGYDDLLIGAVGANGVCQGTCRLKLNS